MVIEKVIGNIDEEKIPESDLDFVYLDSTGLDKSHQRIESESGMTLCISLENGARLHDGDILYRDGKKVIAIAQSDEDALVIPLSGRGDALAGYTIGNMHAPAYISDDRISTPFDPAVENALRRAGIICERKTIKLSGKKAGSHSHHSQHSHHSHGGSSHG